MKEPNTVLGLHEVELASLMETIKAEARKTRKLMSSEYTIHDFDDLVQEGVMCFYRAYELYKAKTKITIPFGKYFYRALVNTFCGILTKSYRQVITESKEPDNFFIRKFINEVSPAKAFALMEKVNKISPEAQRYINMCLNPSPELQCQMTHNKTVRPIREALGLRCYEERQLRKEIENAFRG